MKATHILQVSWKPKLISQIGPFISSETEGPPKLRETWICSKLLFDQDYWKFTLEPIEARINYCNKFLNICCLCRVNKPMMNRINDKSAILTNERVHESLYFGACNGHRFILVTSDDATSRRRCQNERPRGSEASLTWPPWSS